MKVVINIHRICWLFYISRNFLLTADYKIKNAAVFYCNAYRIYLVLSLVK